MEEKPKMTGIEGESVMSHVPVTTDGMAFQFSNRDLPSS
jgi:hypothetical protein